MDHESTLEPARPVAPPPSAGRLGAPLPHPHEADLGRDATRWGAPAQDYATPPDGRSPWTGPGGEPAVLPAAVEPVTERVGWLTAGRLGGPDGA